MPDELNSTDAPGPAVSPDPASDSTRGRRSLSRIDAFDMANASKAAVERALPGWYAERQRLNTVRVRHPETARGDRLVVTLVRAAGVSIAAGLAIVAAVIASSAFGTLAGFALGAAALVVGLAAVSGASLATRALLDRSERKRKKTVAALERSIELLDERIGQAFRYHGLVRHARTRRSF